VAEKSDGKKHKKREKKKVKKDESDDGSEEERPHFDKLKKLMKACGSVVEQCFDFLLFNNKVNDDKKESRSKISSDSR